MSPRALACPASLKSVLAATDAARALADGFARAGVECTQLPVADGGEGTAEAIGGERREAVVSDPLGRPVAARWVVRPDGTAVVDYAGTDAQRPDEALNAVLNFTFSQTVTAMIEDREALERQSASLQQLQRQLIQAGVDPSEVLGRSANSRTQSQGRYMNYSHFYRGSR